MKILAISQQYPNPTQSSGELRFHSILSMLARLHWVGIVAQDAGNSPSIATATANLPTAALGGINMLGSNVAAAITDCSPDLVIFEFFEAAKKYLRIARLRAPKAVMVIDSVDIHFGRLNAKAALSQMESDLAEARRMQHEEIATYEQADLVIVVSHKDEEILRSHAPNVKTCLLPNVHEIGKLTPRDERNFGEMIFVGGFKHEPNVDAILFFVDDVLPRIKEIHPDVKLSIIGSNPPQAVLDLAGVNVTVHGFVPDTAPHLELAYISIASLRYGGGMKGKVGEAMAHGLPVVTTKFGAEGFGLDPGRHLLVADDPQAFSDAVVRLLDDTRFYDQISVNGYDFIRTHYSTEAMSAHLDVFLAQIPTILPKRLPASIRLHDRAKIFYRRHLSWRFAR